MTVTSPMMVIYAVLNPSGENIPERIDPNEMKLPSTKQYEIISSTKFLSLIAALKPATKSFSFGSCSAARLGGLSGFALTKINMSMHRTEIMIFCSISSVFIASLVSVSKVFQSLTEFGSLSFSLSSGGEIPTKAQPVIVKATILPQGKARPHTVVAMAV